MSENGTRRTHFIVNPNAGSGRLAKKWTSEILPFFKSQLPDFGFSLTSQKGDGARLTREALQNGFDAIVTLGGDGTLNEVVNGFFENGVPLNPEAYVAALPFGSGSDFSRTLGLPRKYQSAWKILQRGNIRNIDIGCVEFLDSDSAPHYFVNIANSGVVAAIMAHVNRFKRSYPALLRYLYGSVRGFKSFKAHPVQIQIDDQIASEKLISNVLIANGQYFGRGMKPAPHAQIDDGFFDVTLLKPASFAQFCRYLPHLYLGLLPAHTRLSETFRCRELNLRFSESYAFPFETDGETIGMGDVCVKIIPQALPILSPQICV